MVTTVLRQTDFEPETGLPRWGCKILSWIRASWHAATGREPERDFVLRILADAETRPAPWSPGKTVVTCAGEAGKWELFLWDPTELVKLTLSYAGNGWEGAQHPDLRTWHPAYSPPDGARPMLPWEVTGLAATIVQFARPSADGHWVECDPRGLHILYDPDPSLELDGWRRTGQWRGLRIWNHGQPWTCEMGAA